MDQKKRKTLKILSGFSAAALGGKITNALADTGPNIVTSTNIAEAHKHNKHSQAYNRLKIEIIAGRTAPEDTVIITNQSDRTITVDEFLPGMITLRDQMMDLNQIVKNENLSVKPGYPVATKVARWEMLALPDSALYLQSDDSYTSLSNDTQVISIIATVSHRRALLTLNHSDSNHGNLNGKESYDSGIFN